MLAIQLSTNDFLNSWVLEQNIGQYCLKMTQSDLVDSISQVQLLQNAIPKARCVAIEPPKRLLLEDYINNSIEVAKQLDVFNAIGAHLNRCIIVPFETHITPYDNEILATVSSILGNKLYSCSNIKPVVRNSLPRFNIERDYIEEVFKVANIVKLLNSQTEVHFACGLDIANAETTVRVISLLLESGYGKTSLPFSVVDFMWAMQGNCDVVWIGHRVGADLHRRGYSLPSSVGAFTNTFQNIRRILGPHTKLILNVDEKDHEETIATLMRLSNGQDI